MDYIFHSPETFSPKIMTPRTRNMTKKIHHYIRQRFRKEGVKKNQRGKFDPRVDASSACSDVKDMAYWSLSRQSRVASLCYSMNESHSDHFSMRRHEFQDNNAAESC